MLNLLYVGRAGVMRAEGERRLCCIDCACVLLHWLRERASGVVPNKLSAVTNEAGVRQYHAHSLGRVQCGQLRHRQQALWRCCDHRVRNRRARWAYLDRLEEGKMLSKVAEQPGDQVCVGLGSVEAVLAAPSCTRLCGHRCSEVYKEGS